MPIYLSDLNVDPSTLYASSFKAELLKFAKQPLEICRQKSGLPVSSYLNKNFPYFHGIMQITDLGVQPVHCTCKLSAL